MRYIQTQTNNARLKQVGQNFMLIVDGVKDMKYVEWFLKGML
jgi:transcription-repair coupling factor (superfamily II helicase)